MRGSPADSRPSPEKEGVRRVAVGGQVLAYTEVSPAQPRASVLLLPWLGGSRLGWQAVAQTLGDEYRVLVPDHRDTGDSDPFAGGYTLADLADDAAGFLRAVDAAPACVVGLSMGGMVAQHLALRHPDLVRGLVLVSTTPGGADSTASTARGRAALFLPAGLEPQERARQALALMTYPGFTEAHPEALEVVATQAGRHPMSPDTFRRQFQTVRAHDTTPDLARLRVPTLVLHGEHDDLIPLPNGERLAADIPGAQLRVYSQTGHMPHLERPGEFLRDVREFLDSQAGEG